MKSSKKMILTLVFIAAVMVLNAATTVRFVTVTGGTKGQDGLSWETAAVGNSANIQAQIDAVNANSERGEVRFGAGTYSLTATITLKDGASLIGAYPAVPVSGKKDDRNLSVNKTIFDGGGVRKLFNAPDGEGIVYSHITMMDGLILQRGYSSYGSAITLCYGFVMENCIIRNNRSTGIAGSAIRIYRNTVGVNADPGDDQTKKTGGALINCLIVNNSTTKGAAAISIDGLTNSSIINCVIANNKTTDETPIKVRNVNARGYYPGGVYLGRYAQNSRIANNIFYNNAAFKDADKHIGATFSVNNAYTNYFDGNQAWKDSVAVYYDSPANTGSSYYKNFSRQGNKCGADFEASNIFVAPNAIIGCGTTQAEIDAIDNSDWHLKAGTPCIDGGKSNTAEVIYPYSVLFGSSRAFATILTDLDGKLRVSGKAPDMGSYEFFIEK